MAHYELLQMKKATPEGEVYQIRATADIEKAGVKKGELGGYMCPNSVLEDGAWIKGSATVWKSTLTGNVLVTDTAELVNCKLTGTCYVGFQAKLRNVNGNGLYAEGYSVIKNSTFSTPLGDKTRIQVFGDAQVEDSLIAIMEDGEKLITIQDSSYVKFSDVIGKDILFKGSSSVQNSTIDGEVIKFENVLLAKHLSVKGKHMLFKNAKELRNTTFEADNLAVMGSVQIGDSEIKGNEIEIFGSGVVLEDIYVNAMDVTLRDSVFLAHVDIREDSILVMDCAQVKGLENESVLLNGGVEIRELVHIEIEQGKKARVIVDEILRGDIHYTGQ